MLVIILLIGTCHNLTQVLPSFYKRYGSYGGYRFGYGKRAVNVNAVAGYGKRRAITKADVEPGYHRNYGYHEYSLENILSQYLDKWVESSSLLHDLEKELKNGHRILTVH